jgi:ABC-type antimicrobial peptide transport system permease subunit
MSVVFSFPAHTSICSHSPLARNRSLGNMLAVVGRMKPRSIKGLLFGVSSADPATILAIVAVLAAVAPVAGYLPARRASRIDPMIALRGD